MRNHLPSRRGSISFNYEHDGRTYHATATRYGDGRLAEIFLDCGKIGSAAQQHAETTAVLAGGSYLGDLTVPVLNVDRVVEVKVRAKGFRELYRWLDQRDILIVRADRSEPLVVLPLKLAAEIAAKAGGQ